MDAGSGGIGMNNRLEVVLSSWQRRRLRQIRDHPPSSRVGKRATCLLMSTQAASNQAIMQATGLSSDAITDIRHRWRVHGMASLKDRPRCGRPSTVTAGYRRELRRALRIGPLDFGYIFTVWSVARLNAHLKKLTRISIGESRLRQLIRDEGFVYRRPKHTLKGKRDEKAFRKARHTLSRLKKGRFTQEPTTNSGTRTSPSSTFTPI
jgi:transposase